MGGVKVKINTVQIFLNTIYIYTLMQSTMHIHIRLHVVAEKKEFLKFYMGFYFATNLIFGL